MPRTAQRVSYLPVHEGEHARYVKLDRGPRPLSRRAATRFLEKLMWFFVGALAGMLLIGSSAHAAPPSLARGTPTVTTYISGNLWRVTHGDDPPRVVAWDGDMRMASIVEAAPDKFCQRVKSCTAQPSPAPTRTPAPTAPPGPTLNQRCDVEKSMTLVPGVGAKLDAQSFQVDKVTCLKFTIAQPPHGLLAIDTTNHGNASCADYELRLLTPEGRTSCTSTGRQPGCSASEWPYQGTWMVRVVLHWFSVAPCDVLDLNATW